MGDVTGLPVRVLAIAFVPPRDLCPAAAGEVCRSSLFGAVGRPKGHPKTGMPATVLPGDNHTIGMDRDGNAFVMAGNLPTERCETLGIACSGAGGVRMAGVTELYLGRGILTWIRSRRRVPADVSQ